MLFRPIKYDHTDKFGSLLPVQRASKPKFSTIFRQNHSKKWPQKRNKRRGIKLIATQDPLHDSMVAPTGGWVRKNFMEPIVCNVVLVCVLAR